MAVTLQMVFVNAAGDKVTLSLPDAREDLAAAEVKTAMEGIISRNIFTSSGGDLTAISSARVVTRDTTDIDVLNA